MKHVSSEMNNKTVCHFFKSMNKPLVTVLRSFEKVVNSNPATGVQRLFLPSVFVKSIDT